MSYFRRLIVNALLFISLSVLLPSLISVSSIWIALIASFVLSILNICVKPILVLLSLPITALTFGLFSFVVNAFILKMTAFFVGDQNFMLSGFGAALLVAVIMSIVNMIVTDYHSDVN